MTRNSFEGVLPAFSGYGQVGPIGMIDNYGRGNDRYIEDICQMVSSRYGGQMAERVYRALLGNDANDGDRAALQAQLKEYAEAFQQLKKMAAPYATVSAVRGERVTITFAGKTLEVEKPKDKTLSAGQTVRITPDTMQIIDVVADDEPAGEVVPVTRVVSPTRCEVSRAGGDRAVSYAGALEEGDRVVLDAGGTVIVSNLGKPKDDGAVEATGVTWDDIGWLVEAKRQMREAVESPTKHADMMARYNKRPIRGVLLYGLPGCGKTMLGKAAATALAEINGNAAGGFIYVKGPSLLNMYVGNSEENVRKLFAQARRYKKKTGGSAIIFIDEADAILGKRGDGRGLTSTIVPAFLAEMDGLEDSGALVLLATNRPGTLDPAVVRDGRVDRRIKVTAPTQADAREIVTKLLAKRPIEGTAKNLAREAIAALFDDSLVMYRVKRAKDEVPMTLGNMVNGAMLAGLVERATSLAMGRELDGGASGMTADDLRNAAAETFKQSLDVDHTDEIMTFIEGWEHDVFGIAKAAGRGHESAHKAVARDTAGMN